MRDRHLPRLCRTCQAPMARQENGCWRCGARWATEDRPRSTLRVLIGEASTDHARAPAIAAFDADRWLNEGGALDTKAEARGTRR
jgi:predicted amidophosphoribosyltransferase